MSDPHTEHRHDRSTGRPIGFDPRVNEWQPCEAQLTLDEHDPDAMDDRDARLRAELDRLDVAKAQARLDALDRVNRAATARANAAATLADEVAAARGFGATWQQIADAVGTTRSNAWERWADHG